LRVNFFQDKTGAAGGEVRKESTLLLWQPRSKAALRLTANPFGSQASHFPYITIGMATQGETFADSDLWFRVENRERHSPVAVDE